MTKNKFETDWLASEPVFYNEKTLKISHNINDVIDYNNLKFHPEGLNNYLDYGYSVFEQTPVKNVKFLPPNSSIKKQGSKLIIKINSDPVIDWFKRHNTFSSVNDCLNVFKRSMQKIEDSATGKLIIPTSGGLDSRLLNYFVSDKSRIQAYTYGVSSQQNDSFEVVYAKEICKSLDISWSQIHLNSYLNYIDDWYNLYGVSTHAHGMYHLEFYEKIASYEGINATIISGIVGDAWAGSVKLKKMSSFEDVYNLGYSHGLHADSTYSKFKSKGLLQKTFFEKKQKVLQNPKTQVIELIRMKMILLSYLLKVPKKLGFEVKSPFLDIDVALTFCNLNPKFRKNRKWQKKFFQDIGLDIESKCKNANKSLFLNSDILMNTNLQKLDVRVLSEILNEDYVKKINQSLFNPSFIENVFFKMHKQSLVSENLVFYFKRILTRIFGYEDSILKAYNAYMVLRPLEDLIKRKYEKA